MVAQAGIPPRLNVAKPPNRRYSTRNLARQWHPEVLKAGSEAIQEKPFSNFFLEKPPHLQRSPPSSDTLHTILKKRLSCLIPPLESDSTKSGVRDQYTANYLLARNISEFNRSPSEPVFHVTWPQSRKRTEKQLARL